MIVSEEKKNKPVGTTPMIYGPFFRKKKKIIIRILFIIVSFSPPFC
jgi:hypothetical protein